MSTYIEVSRYRDTGNVLHHEVQTRERTADMCSQVDRPTISGLWRGSCHNRTKVHLGLACTGFGTARPSWWSSTMSSWRSLDAPNEWHPQALPEASNGPHLIQRMKLNLKLNLNGMRTLPLAGRWWGTGVLREPSTTNKMATKSSNFIVLFIQWFA